MIFHLFYRVMEQVEMGPKIANIKFSVFKRRAKAYHNRVRTQPCPEFGQSQRTVQKKTSEVNITRYSSLIPTTLIKTSKLLVREKKYNITAIYTPTSPHAKFPCRKPKSKPSRPYFPVFRSKKSSFSEVEESLPKAMEIRMREKPRGKSCFDIKHYEEEKHQFVRYSQNILTTEYIDRSHRTEPQEERGRLSP